MRILFVASNRLGDAVVSTGLLDHLIQIHPSARITIACGPVAEEAFQRMPNLERIVVFSKMGNGRHWVMLWATTVTRLWDLAVDIRGSALPWLIIARNRAIMRPSGGHKIRQLARILQLDDPPLPVVWFSSVDIARISTLLPTNRPVIALAPTANWAPKVWPGHRFTTFFQQFADKYLPSAVPAVIAGPGETEAAIAIPVLQSLPSAINLIGRLSLPEVAAFLSRSSLFVGNDSGLMHIAAASGAPTLGLFGPTNAQEYAPSGKCTLALSSPNATMDRISVEAALEAA